MDGKLYSYKEEKAKKSIIKTNIFNEKTSLLTIMYN